MPRRNITTDEETERLIEAHDINASQAFRSYIKDNYGTIKQLEDKRNELEARKDRLVDEIYQKEKEKASVEKELNRISSLLSENRVVQQIKEDGEARQRFNQAVKIIKREKKVEDGTTVESMAETHAEVISDSFGFDESKIKDALVSVADVETG
jgi:neutral trehalase